MNTLHRLFAALTCSFALTLHAAPADTGTLTGRVTDASTHLALFGTVDFAGDREGISIYRHSDGPGYILVSDQQANRFQVFPREGLPGHPHEHPRRGTFAVSAIESDGSDVTATPLGARFPHGLFVAMSNGRTFHFYGWEQITAATGLK